MFFHNCHFNAVLAVFAACFVVTARGIFYRECIGAEKSQKFVGSQDNCAKYIYCDGNNSFEGECLDDNFFNVTEGKCAERTAVVCKIGEQANMEGRNQGSENSQGSPASASLWDGGRVNGVNMGNFFNTTTNSNSNNNNINNKNMNSNINWNAIVGPSSIQQQQQAKQQQMQSAWLAGGIVDSAPVIGLAQNAIDMGNTGANTNEADQSPQCPISYGLQNVIYLANARSCATYFTCYNGIAIPMICPRHTYFNEATSRCDHQDNVYCPLHRPVRLICNRGVYDYMPHPRNCGYYYFCSNGYLMIFQCPFQYMWHYERRTCVHRSQAKCFSGAIAEAMLG
ncbi:uncharacterized protein LOC129238496 [Anastrepha obliqua]|uniref:uncharacterized protein LOC129238496 n=1 Tax=Anastrepha obliqua TaxID=95512 RepID=UPI00240A5B56|nr:uncharacterized protein LOC129238496 [Anastrepha obliqua]